MSWPPAEYGEAWADVYDEAHAHLADDAVAATAFLDARLPRTARVVELGVGTGRLAIPLASLGHAVTGIDASPAMLAALAAKPGGDRVRALVGDMADPPLVGPVDLVLIGFNTLFALPTQDAQVRCLQRAAGLLGPAGELVVEAAVPRPWQPDPTATGDGGPDGHVVLEVGDHDPTTQVLSAARVVVSAEAGVRALPLRLRYAHPPEIDLMARLAGLALRQRHAGWAGEPFDRDATRHVSVYDQEAR